jgi:hypothetical protein
MIFMLAATFSARGQVPEPVPGWPYITSIAGFADCAVPRFEMRQEPGLSAIFFNTLTGELDKWHLDGSFFSNWPVVTETLLFGSTPIILDIDHDGQAEFLVDGAARSNHYNYSLVLLIDDDGSIMPGFPIQAIRPITLSCADLDSDNEHEIIYYSADEGLLYCIDHFGAPKPGWPVAFDLPGARDGYQLNRPGGAVGDFDLDGLNEYLISGVHGIYVFRYDGSMQPGFPIIMADTTYFFYNSWFPPILADIDNDGYLEILTSGDNWAPTNPDFQSFLAIYEHTGQMKDGWPPYFPRRFIKNTPTPSDINADGFPEIGFQVGESLTYISNNGNPLPNWPVRLTSPDGTPRGASADLITADIDGDRNLEIFTDYNAFFADSLGHDSVWYWGYSYLFAIDHEGANLPGWPIRLRGSYLGRPPSLSMAEISGRIYLGLSTEMLFLDTLSIELFLFPDSTGPPDQWPMLSHDNLQTRNYNFVDRVTSIYDNDEIIPKNYILKQNYPNPFNYSTMLEYVVPKTGYVKLSLFDILGRKVVDLEDQILTAGTHRQRLTLSDFPSGVYFLTLSAENTRITRKMTLVK